MKVLVVDDEAIARRRLIRQLGRLDEVEVIGEASDGDEALALIESRSPDLVLLDVEMPGTDGLEVVARLDAPPHIVFVTAYEQYAVRAFEASAVDYLLKPVDPARLERALERVRRLRAPLDASHLRELLQRMLPTPAPEAPRLSARSGDTLRLFDAREVARLRAEHGYTVFRHEGGEYVLEESIVALARRLEPFGFFRIHRGELVQLDRIRALRRVDDQTVVELEGGETAPISRRLLPELKRRLGIEFR